MSAADKYRGHSDPLVDGLAQQMLAAEDALQEAQTAERDAEQAARRARDACRTAQERVQRITDALAVVAGDPDVRVERHNRSAVRSAVAQETS